MSQLNSIWVLTDGKTGDVTQCRGVANALRETDRADGVRIEERIVAPGRFWAAWMPWGPIDPKDAVSKAASPINPGHEGWPSLVLASGRRSVPYMRAIAYHSAKAGQPSRLVFLKDPRGGDGPIDLIWMPKHDDRTGSNIFKTWTSPHLLTSNRLQQAHLSGVERFGEKQPTIGLILGGNSGHVRYDAETSAPLIQTLSDLAKDLSSANGRVLVTASRRTPPELLQRVRQSLSCCDAWIWDGSKDNPYHAILALSQQLIITGDSHNMVSEALATDATIHVFRPKGLSSKLHRFLDAMESDGQIVPLSTRISLSSTTSRRPINATPDIAHEILQRLFS